MIPLATAVGAVVLVVSGLVKIADPAPAASLLAALVGARGDPPPAASVAGRLSGVVEVGAGLAALLVEAVAPVVVVTLLYAAFTVVVIVARRRDLDCACLGRRSGVPGPVHLVVDLVLVGAALTSTVTGRTPAAALAGSGPAGALVVGAAAGMVVWVLSRGPGGPQAL